MTNMLFIRKYFFASIFELRKSIRREDIWTAA